MTENENVMETATQGVAAAEREHTAKIPSYGPCLINEIEWFIKNGEGNRKSWFYLESNGRKKYLTYAEVYQMLKASDEE